MLISLYPVFDLDGEKYVADISGVLTSGLPKYNCYRLKDKKHAYVECSKITHNEFMYPYDFFEWMHGKTSQVTTLNGVTTVSSGVSLMAGQQGSIGSGGQGTIKEEVAPVVHKRQPTEIELLTDRVAALEEQIKKLSLKPGNW